MSNDFCDGCSKRCEFGSTTFRLTTQDYMDFYYPTIGGKVITAYYTKLGRNTILARPTIFGTQDATPFMTMCLGYALCKHCPKHIQHDKKSDLPELRLPDTEILTEERFQNLFGANHKLINHYNVEALCYRDMSDIDRQTRLFVDDRPVNSCLPAHQRMVALLTASVANDCAQYNFGDTVSAPVFAPQANTCHYVGGILVRDINTGKILPPATWIYAGTMQSASRTHDYRTSLRLFVQRLQENPAVVRNLVGIQR